MIDVGGDFGRVLKVGAHKRDAVPGRRGGERQVRLHACVEADPAHGYRLGYGCLALTHSIS
jgi:hypothetical protein